MAAKPPKRKRDEPPQPQEINSKSMLNNYATLLIGSVAKGDIVCTCVQQPDTTYVCAVQIPKYSPEEVWNGAPAADKKGAEQNACAVAVEALGPIVAPLQEEVQQKKIAKREERIAL